jgi:tetratricopeptide (TPR) repeat protein
MAVSRARETAVSLTLLDLQSELVTRYHDCKYYNLFEQGMKDIFTGFPHDLNFFQSVGTIYRDAGRIEDTIKVYNEAMRLFPRSSYKLSNMFMSLPAEECDRTIPILRKAVSLQPADFSLRFLYASNLCLCNLSLECETNLLEAKKIDPGEKGVDKLLNELYEYKKHNPEAFKGGQPK